MVRRNKTRTSQDPRRRGRLTEQRPAHEEEREEELGLPHRQSGEDEGQGRDVQDEDPRHQARDHGVAQRVVQAGGGVPPSPRAVPPQHTVRGPAPEGGAEDPRQRHRDPEPVRGVPLVVKELKLYECVLIMEL